MSQTSLKKQHGAHDTPPALAAFLAGRALGALKPGGGTGAIVVLDPACGRGNLLAAAARAAPASWCRRLVLAGCERDLAAWHEARATLDGLSRVRAVDLRNADFLALDASNWQADIVLANPPYVRTQVLGSAQARGIAHRFGLTGRVDLYQAFIHAIAETLRPGGVLGLIASNRFLSTRAGADVRRLLRTHFKLLEILDLGDTRLFPTAAVLPAMVVARRCEGSTPVASSCPFLRAYEHRPATGQPAAGVADTATPLFPGVLEALAAGARGRIRAGRRVFGIERGMLAPAVDPSAPWALWTDDQAAWLEQVEAHRAGCLGDVGPVRVGIKTTADAVFLREDWDTLPPALRPEPDLLRPVITHGDVSRWSAPPDRIPGGTTGRRLLYPHEVRNGRRVPIELDAYPCARAYLESHRARLEARHYVRAAGRRWYEVWVPQDPAGWAAPKVVFPDIAEHPRACLDTSGALVNGDCYWITPAAAAQVDGPGPIPPRLLLVLAVLNSTFAAAYYDARYHNKLYAGRRRFITQYVETFPLPALETPAASAAVAIARRLVAGGRPADEAESLEDEADRLVWAAFGLVRPRA